MKQVSTIGTREYRVIRTGDKKYQVQICFGLLDTPTLRGGYKFEKQADAIAAIRAHAENTHVRPLIIQGV